MNPPGAHTGSIRSSGGRGIRRRSYVSGQDNASRVSINYDIPGNTVNTRPSVPVLGDHARESRSTILRRRYDPVQFEGFDDVRLPWEYLKTRLEHLDSVSTISNLCRHGMENVNENNLHPYLRHVMTFKYPMVFPPNQPQKKALLIFSKFDEYFELLQAACAEEYMTVQVARSGKEALNMLSNSNDYFDVVLIDARSSKNIDAECISMSIRRSYIHLCTPIVAIVKKNFYKTPDRLQNFLSSGVSRCIVENCSLSSCCCELKQIQNSLIWNQQVMSVQQVLYTALHNLEESLIITDAQFTIQYANNAVTKLLNVCLEEVISAPLEALLVANISSIRTESMYDDNFEFVSNMMVRRKNLDSILMHVYIVPVACLGRTATHYVVHINPAKENIETKLPKECNSSNTDMMHQPKVSHQGYFIPTSEGASQRLSLVKINAQPLEAPITKIINILTQIQESSSPEESKLIDKVLNFMQKEGLYMPQIKDKKNQDPITSDLIGALLKDSTKVIPRRNSSESLVKVRSSITLPANVEINSRIHELLENILHWEFDIFQFETETENLPLRYLGMELFRRFDVFATLNISEYVCRNWLAMVESNYHAQNSYHNSTHAADVMQAIGVFISQLASKELLMDRLEEATALIAAAVHDIDHPGRSSAFLCNSGSPLAILYNDSSVLESHHAATTFRLTLRDDNVNIFKNLDKDMYKLVRNTIIDMVMATEMTKHFEHLTKFVSAFGTSSEMREIVQTEEESSKLMRRMLIKVADLSNPARPTPFSIEWAHRIAEEYFKQTEEEKTKNMPVVMPMFDRSTCSIPKSQIGFMDYIIHDMMFAWDSFIDMPELVAYMKLNYSTWKNFEDRGIRTLNEIRSATSNYTVSTSLSN